MNFPWKSPVPIVRESYGYRRAQKIEKKTLKQKLLSKNNRATDDGRIHLKQEGDITWAITINPKRLVDYKVMELNVEPKLHKLVRSLVRKRYYTLSSCQSHGPSFNCYVTCAIYTTGLAHNLVESFNKFGWSFAYAKIMRPEEYINSSFDEKTETMVHLKPTPDQALEAVNNMLETQLDSVHIVQLVIRRSSNSLWESLAIRFVDKFFLDRRLAKLVKIVDGLPSENFLGEQV